MTNDGLNNNDVAVPMQPGSASRTETRTRTTEGKRGASTLSMNVIDQPTEFLLLRTEWNELVDASPVRIFQTFDWQWFWWKHYGEGLQLHIITFRDEQRLVGIVPLFLQASTFLGVKVRGILRMIGCGIGSKENYGLPAEYGPSDYLDVIVRPGFETRIAAGLSEFLRKYCTQCNELRLENVPHESVLYRYFLLVFEAEHLHCSILRNEIAPYIETPASFNEYAAHLSPGMRHHIRQARKQFKNHPPFFIEEVTSQSMLQQVFSDLVRLHQARWNRLGYAGLFSDKRFLNFQKDVARKFYEQGTLWFKTVRMGGIHTAARMGFMFKGRLYDYLSGFDETFPEGKKRPSLALLLEMIEDAILSKCSAIDLLRGTEEYKLKMTSTIAQNSDIRVTGFNDGSPILHAVDIVAGVVHKLFRKIADEGALFSVHCETYGFPQCLLRYFRFVVVRGRQKLYKGM